MFIYAQDAFMFEDLERMYCTSSIAWSYGIFVPFRKDFCRLIYWYAVKLILSDFSMEFSVTVPGTSLSDFAILGEAN